MKLSVVSTTDGRYIGHTFDIEDNPIQLAPDVRVFIEKIIPLSHGMRFINSNYIIDAIED